jgi:hypothetical protein
MLFNKTFAEALAIGTGLAGIAFTMQDFTSRALFMDTLSFIAAVSAMLMGLNHIRYLKKHFLIKKMVLCVGIGVLIVMPLFILTFFFGLYFHYDFTFTMWAI